MKNVDHAMKWSDCYFLDVTKESREEFLTALFRLKIKDNCYWICTSPACIIN